MQTFSLLASLAIVSALAALSGCDQAADCASVCERYRSCFDSDYDVDACKTRCNDKADDDAFRARTNECDACINERDCVDTAFACGGECSAVIEE